MNENVYAFNPKMDRYERVEILHPYLPNFPNHASVVAAGGQLIAVHYSFFMFPDNRILTHHMPE